MGAESGGEDSITYPDVGIRVDQVEFENNGFFVIRTLRLFNLQVRFFSLSIYQTTLFIFRHINIRNCLFI